MRLIDADELAKEHCEDCSLDVQNSCKTDPVCASLMWIVNAPTVDVYTEQNIRDAFNDGYSVGMEQNVRHGKWQPMNERNEIYGDVYMCDNCGHGFVICENFHYCPNCGALWTKWKGNNNETKRNSGSGSPAAR